MIVNVDGYEYMVSYEDVKKLDEEIIEGGRTMAGHQTLSGIKGIGEKSATILYIIIGYRRYQ